MSQETREQSITVFERARIDVFADGQISRTAIRALCPGLTECQFGMAWTRWKQQIYRETGYLLRPVPRSGGAYRLDTPEEGIGRAANTERVKVVKQAEKHLASLVSVQRREDLTEDSRARMSREETIASRNTALVRRSYLLRQAKKPAGLE